VFGEDLAETGHPDAEHDPTFDHRDPFSRDQLSRPNHSVDRSSGPSEVIGCLLQGQEFVFHELRSLSSLAGGTDRDAVVDEHLPHGGHMHVKHGGAVAEAMPCLVGRERFIDPFRSERG
jgi:hypothetical protein